MAEPRTFEEVLNAAVEDILQYGFDSQERVDRWLRQLAEAARAAMIDPASLEQRLRDALADQYRKAVDEGGVLKLNPGVSRFTIEKVKPALRGELDRRIAASANLIKLNRQQAIEKTLQRFQGWSSSVPPGGVSGETKRAIKATVRKSLGSLPFEERRVLIDQGHKLVSSISEIVAADGGAIAGRWHSHWRQAGYNYRKDHKERDQVVYLVRNSWADTAGYVKKGGNPYYDQITAVGQEPFCRCYMVWIYNVRDLPDEMVTAKGRQALATARARAAEMQGQAKADSAVIGGEVSPKAAGYTPVWANKPTRCQRCSMFVPLTAAVVGNACTAVAGEINRVGHCGLFEIRHRADSEGDDPPAPGISFEGHRLRFERIRRQLERVS